MESFFQDVKTNLWVLLKSSAFIISKLNNSADRLFACYFPYPDFFVHVDGLKLQGLGVIFFQILFK